MYISLNQIANLSLLALSLVVYISQIMVSAAEGTVIDSSIVDKK